MDCKLNSGATGRKPVTWLLAMLLSLSVLAGCGGSGGGSGPDGAGQGLVLVSFLQDSLDNVALNDLLVFRFSEAVNPASVSGSSIQIREGNSFGLQVPGRFLVSGSTVYFEPRLPSRCDLADSGLKAGTVYSVQLLGYPEFNALENSVGEMLPNTMTMEFTTRGENDPLRFTDQVPGQGPVVTAMSPADGDYAVDAGDTTNRQRIEISLSENIDPCTVSAATVRVSIYERGGSMGQSITAPNGNQAGFVTSGTDLTDQDPSPFTWGSDTGTAFGASAQSLPVTLHLLQDTQQTRLVISPLNGQDATAPEQGGILPENVLLVVELRSGITDFAGQSLVPFAGSFTTENLPASPGVYTIENAGETPYDTGATTMDINTARSPGLAQGFMLFSGDGDNGADVTMPSLPETPGSGCTVDRQGNDNSPDDFDPTTDLLLDTGVVNTCTNVTDGSTAVVWEFNSFRIRSGITVRITGQNPAIFLVTGDVTIEAGGILRARADGSAGVPQGNGKTGYAWVSTKTAPYPTGGEAVAGGGNGGDAPPYDVATITHGGDGFSAFGSASGFQVEGGEGAGLGGTIHDTVYPNSPGTSQGGGGGGHGVAGETATNTLGTGHTNQGATRGDGGSECPQTGAPATRMLEPSAGAGGGAGGNEEWSGTYKGLYSTGGGSGGAGGGFVDITSSGNIQIYGMIDAAGSRGGSGGTTTYYAGPGGGGGGAGGGIRLLTPDNIVLSATAIVTTAGGAGGNSTLGTLGTGGPQNHGGAGGHGRVVMEDSDSVIDGLALATVIPTEGETGFYRGTFDSTRFSGGGLTPRAVTQPFAVGPLNPTFPEPVQADFVAGAPSAASPGTGQVVMLIEAQSYAILANGDPEATGNGWRTIGYFTDSGVETAPTWNAGHPGSVARSPDNVGNPGIDNMASLNGDEYVQFRFTAFMSTSAGPEEPGAYLDRWAINFLSDN